MKKRKTIATQCDCCGGIIYYGDTCDVFMHSVAQYEGSYAEFMHEKLRCGDIVKHLCSACSERFADIDRIRPELAKALAIDLRFNRSNLRRECDQCGTELRTGHSWLALDLMSAEIVFGESNRPEYRQKHDYCLLEICARCGARIGREEASVACHNLLVAIAGDACVMESDHDEDYFRDEKEVLKHTAPPDTNKLTAAGIVTREHLKGRFFRVDIDWGSSGIWETDRPCLVGGTGYNMGYEEFELPGWLLKRFQFWEHWHEEFSPMDNLPIDFDWASFDAYGRSLAVDLKYHLGPDISVCYRDKEVTLGPLFREPVVSE